MALVMRTMYDTVTPANIPANAGMVAGYLNGKYAWMPSDWARFPNAVRVGISVRAYYQVGHVLDVETGDATPAESVGWVLARRAAGADPSVYCDRSTWPRVRSAFAARNVAEPHYWIATATGRPEVPTGAVAAQYAQNVAGVDMSVVADYWPGVDPLPADPVGASEVEIMERFTVTPPDLGEHSFRVYLSGSAGAAIIVRPRIQGDGYAKPMWIGAIFAWASNHNGIGHNPKNDPNYDAKLTSHRRYELPGALWADVNYSAAEPFDVDIVG
jgi:hypothetical protein